MRFRSDVLVHDFDDMVAMHSLQKTHRVAVFTHQAWRVPVFEGCFVPAEEEDPMKHAILMMVLFKPWRSLVTDLFGINLTDEAIVKDYRTWREHIRNLTTAEDVAPIPTYNSEL